MKIIDKTYNNPVLTIVLIALLVRLVMFLLYQHLTVYPDSSGYLELANRLSHFNLAGYEGQRSPGYPLLLAAIGSNHLLIGIAQTILGVASLVYTYKTLLLLKVGAKLSLLVTILVSCYLPIVFFELAILSETFTLFCITFIFYFFFRFLNDKGTTKGNVTWLILFSCLLVSIKPFYIFLPSLLCLFFLVKNIRQQMTNALLLFLCPLSVFLAWSCVNKLNTDYFSPTTFYGFNLAQNCVSFAEHTTDEYAYLGQIYARYRDVNIAEGRGVAMSIWDAYPALEEGTGLSFPDLSNELYKYSKVTITANPVAYAKQVFISWLDFWKTSMYCDFDSFVIASASSVIKYISLIERIVFQLAKVAFVLLIPFVCVRYIRYRELSASFVISLVVITASILQALLTYGTNSRFSYPFELLMLISMLSVVVECRDCVKQKS